MDTHLLQTELEALAAQRYPLHMPGHKRRQPPAPGLGCFAWDLTEIDGSDDLHDADGILADAMRRTAALCGAARSWYLVNGSTVGLLAAIRALVPFGGEVLCACNCHKAVYHAVELNHLTAHRLAPALVEGFGLFGSVSPAAVEAALAAHPRTACVIVTSPTYEGVLSDVAALAAVCHAHGIPLLVDEAHGAHYLPLAVPYGWQGGALAAGADVVVQSPHKTLPSLTQTALLHLGAGSLASADALARELGVFETSSPSYPLMASLDGCTGLLRAHGDAWFARWRARLDRFDEAVRPLSRVRMFCHGADTAAAHPAVFAVDRGKILADIGSAGAAFLRARGLEPEMVCGSLVLCMTSPCDEEDALDRLAQALCGWDAALAAADPATAGDPAAPAYLTPAYLAPGETVCPIFDALQADAHPCPLRQAAGRIAAEYVWAYPPGVPLLAPGERVGEAFLAAHAALTAAGTVLRHTANPPPGTLQVLTDPPCPGK